MGAFLFFGIPYGSFRRCLNSHPAIQQKRGRFTYRFSVYDSGASSISSPSMAEVMLI
jgi:hypothetical protein